MDHFEIVKRARFVLLLRNLALRKSSIGLRHDQIKPLLFIAANEGCTQAELAKELNVSEASVAVSTQRMEKAELIEKRQDDKNRRRNLLYVTQKGKTLLEEGKREHIKVNSQLFKGFSEQELQQTVNILDRIIFNMTGENLEINCEAYKKVKRDMEAIDGKK